MLFREEGAESERFIELTDIFDDDDETCATGAVDVTSFILLADGPVSPLDALRGIKYMRCHNRYSATSVLLIWDENTSMDRVKYIAGDVKLVH